MTSNSDNIHARAVQIADSYIKENWGLMAFENIAFDVSLYNHWLAMHDAAIFILEKEVI